MTAGRPAGILSRLSGEKPTQYGDRMPFDAIWPKILSMVVGALVLAGWERWINPWIVETFKEPIKLGSNFIGVLKWEDVGVHKIEMRPKKLGYDISGSLRFVEGKHVGKEYVISGRYQHGLLTFTYRPDDPQSTSQGSGTFLRSIDGKRFTGHFAYVGESSGVIESVPCEFNAA